MNWTVDDARRTYNIRHWSSGYFDIAENGNVVAQPHRRDDAAQIDLYEAVGKLRQQGLSVPVLMRFPDILDNRVKTLNEAFSKAITERQYQGSYTSVYPIKVNQQRSVVERLAGNEFGDVGLEAGSKPELSTVLAVAKPNSVIICNGYKDREYIRLALIGQKLGHRVYIVLEKPFEIETVIREAADLGISPLLGFRIRLASIGAGKWQNTGGVKSKFGLTATQMLNAIERLKTAGMLECVQLLHFHLGSQLANIRDIQKGMREASRFYVQMHTLGIPVKIMDVGGGLGVDYEGTRTRSFHSRNYSTRQYANTIVTTIQETCVEEGIAHPDIITESGRSMTAHHAVLVTEVSDVDTPCPDNPVIQVHDDDPIILHDFKQRLDESAEVSPLELYHDAQHWMAESQSMYSLGMISLEQRARVEQMYLHACQLIRPRLQAERVAHREVIDELNEMLADKYICNLSVFQSLPDVWAIRQIFPIVPVHRLDTRPSRRAVIGDLTCDSDGRIDYYVDDEGIESTVPLHEVDKEQPYYIGIFLVGAYQEILGDMHNLFGDTDSVDVLLADDGSIKLNNLVRGDTVDTVLRQVNFDVDDLRAAYEQKLARRDLPEDKKQQYLEELAEGLTGYTYLEE